MDTTPSPLVSQGVDDYDPEGIPKKTDKLALLEIHKIVDHYEWIIKGLSKPPIIISPSAASLCGSPSRAAMAGLR
jgi:hypothetical protein